MKSRLKKMSVIVAFALTGAVTITTGCGGHPAYKLESSEGSKVRIIEKDGKLVKLEVNQNAVTEVALAAESVENKLPDVVSNKEENKAAAKLQSSDRKQSKVASVEVKKAENKSDKEQEKKLEVIRESKQDIKEDKQLNKQVQEKDNKQENKKDSKTDSKQENKKDSKKENKKESKQENKKDSKIDNKQENKQNNKQDKSNEKDKKPKKGKENKSGNKPAKKKIWVPAVYKTVKHPAVTKQEISVHWVCQCGEVFYSDEDWQAHRPKP